MAHPQRLSELLSGWGVDPNQASAAQTKVAEELASALRKAQAEYESFAAKAKAANAELSDGSKTAMDGITSLARSFVMLGAVGERDLQKTALALAKVEVTAGFFKGLINTVEGAVKVWGAYRAAVVAAAEAEVAAGRMRAASVTGGGVAGLGATGVGAVATGFGGVAVGKATVGGATGAGLTAGAGLAAAAGGGFGLTMEYQFARDIYRHGFGRGATPGSAMDLVGGYEAGAFDWIARQFGFDPQGNTKSARMQAKSNAADTSTIELARMREEAQRRKLNEQSTQDQVRMAERQASAARAGIGKHGFERERAELEDMRRTNREDRRGATDPGERLRAVNEALQLQKESIRLTHEEYREKIAAARESLNLHQQELQTIQQKMQAMMQERGSAISSLASLDPLSAQATKEAIRRARGGEDISMADAERLRRTRLSEFDGIIQKTEERRVAALGLSEAIAPLTDAINASGQREQTVKSKIELDERLTVTLEQDESKLVTKLAEMIVPLIEKRTKAVIDQIRKLNQDEAIQEKAKLAQEHLSKRP